MPAIATEALDEVTGIHLSNAGDDVKVKDTVTYKNLIPGLTYRVAGTVMDKDTKKPLQNGGRDITAEAVFTPETADGTVDVEFTFSAKEFAGKTMVLFEKLYLVKMRIMLMQILMIHSMHLSQKTHRIKQITHQIRSR